MRKTKVVFFGSSSYVLPIIDTLKKNFDLKLVVTTEKSPTDPVITFCKKTHIKYVSVSSVLDKNLQSLIINHKSVIGVLADFGLIVPHDVLNIFPKGIINIHPSLLPKYRGPTPVQEAILNGEKTTGITIIKLDNEIDHGPILTQQKETILENDTSKSLYERLFRLSSSLIVRTIKLYLKGEIIPREQDHTIATFTKPLTRADGYIDISYNKPISSKKLQRMIRALYPWPGVWFKWKMEDGIRKIIKLLPEGKIQVEGKKPISYKDFINGYPKEGKKLLEKLGIKY